MTQVEAADNAGVAASTWRMIESGRAAGFRTLTLVSVARSLGWPSDALLGMSLPSHSSVGEVRPSSLHAAIDALSPSDQLIVNALVDRLAEPQG